MDRRHFLKQAAIGTAGFSLINPSQASTSVESRVHALRRRWAAQRRDAIRGMTRSEDLQKDLIETRQHIANCLGALGTYKELESWKIRDQVHPATQALFLDVAAAMGAGASSSARLVQSFIEQSSEPEAQEAQLREALGEMRMGLSDWKTTMGRQTKLRQTLLDLEAERPPGQLLRETKKRVRDLKRLERLAGQIHGSWGRSGLLDESDPVRTRLVVEARQSWSDSGIAMKESKNPTIDQILGVLILGIGLTGGLWVGVMGGCMVSCSDSQGVLLLLLSAGILTAGGYVGIRLIQREAAWTRQQESEE